MSFVHYYQYLYIDLVLLFFLFLFFVSRLFFFFFFFNDTATTEIYTLSLHDALPIYAKEAGFDGVEAMSHMNQDEVLKARRSEEHTSELQSPCNLVCRLLLEKKKNKKKHNTN